MVDSVDALILTDRRVAIEKITEQLGFSVVAAHESVHDKLAFSKFTCRCVH